MSQPLFGRTASTEDAAQYAQKYKLDFIDLHFRGDETFCAGPIIPLLRETLQSLIGDGDTLVYDFGRYQAHIRQAGWDYPRHEIMTWNVPLTHYGANPDQLEFEIVQE